MDIGPEAAGAGSGSTRRACQSVERRKITHGQSSDAPSTPDREFDLEENVERIAISFNLQHAEDLGSYHHGDDFDYSILDYE